MFKRWVVGLALVALAVGSASAQQGQRGRGFSGRGGGGITAAGLVRSEAVQKELGLDEAGIAKLRAVGEDYQALVQKEMEAAGVSFQNQRDLPEAERAAAREKAAAITAKLATGLKEKLKGAMTAEQYTRLQQIQWQAAGSEALSDADLAAALGLSDEQKTKIAAALKDYSDKRRALFGAGAGEDARAKLTELRKEVETATTGILTADQQAKLTELKGKPFDVAALTAGGRGRRGGNNNNNDNN